MSNDSAPGDPGAEPAARPANTRFTPVSDASARSASPKPEPKPGPFLWCSDCRTAMRTYYYALETRPLCQKCKVPYAAQIARGSGPGSMVRVLLYGGGAALGCALLLGVAVLAVGFVRIVAAIGVGYAVGRAVNYASGSFYDTRFRLIAAFLTYFAIGLGSLSPVIKAVIEAPDVPVAVAAEASGEDDAEVAATDDADRYEDMTLDEIATEMEADREAAQEAARNGTTGDAEEAAAAQELKQKGLFSFLGSMALLLVTIPLLANFAYGLYAGAIGVMALGYGVYKAWLITGETVGVLMSGPHRVGTGPVPQTMGGDGATQQDYQP